MENNKSLNKYVHFGLVIVLSLVFILFTQQVKLWKNPDSSTHFCRTWFLMAVQYVRYLDL